jgi:hypothetical protein
MSKLVPWSSSDPHDAVARAEDRVGQVAGTERVALRAALDRGEVERVVDESREPLGLADDRQVVLRPLFVGVGEPEEQRLRLDADLRDRRSQLVRHAGSEVGLHVRDVELAADEAHRQHGTQHEHGEGEQHDPEALVATDGLRLLQRDRILRRHDEGPSREPRRETPAHELAVGERLVRREERGRHR